MLLLGAAEVLRIVAAILCAPIVLVMLTVLVVWTASRFLTVVLQVLLNGTAAARWVVVLVGSGVAGFSGSRARLPFG
mgnify:CR=1 FL=1